MARYDVHLQDYYKTAFSTHGYVAKGRGYAMYYTHSEWGQPYGKAYHWIRNYGNRLEKVYFLKSECRNFWQHARYYKGARYRHRKGSKYQVRYRTHIVTYNNGPRKITLQPGDWVGFNQGQGYASQMGGSYFRCDGFYRKGRWYEVSGGYVYMPTHGNSANYTLRTN